MTQQIVACGGCGNPLDERFDLSPERRRPCPACGSTVRAFSINLSETISVHTELGLKHKDQSGKTLAESKSGDYFYKKAGRWLTRERSIDHVNDHYKEVFRDAETNKVLHSWDEPLSAHRGHGSDNTFTNRLKRKWKQIVHFVRGGYRR